MSLNYNILESLKLLINCFKYDIFWCLLIGVIIFTIILIINKDKKYINYIILGLNILIILLICYYYINDIISFKFSNPINNLYFYMFNTIIYFIIMYIINIKTNYKIFNYMFYSLSLLNIGYSIFMTHYLSNISILVIGNIFPIIKFGNILYFIYYLLITIKFIYKYIVFDKKN